MDNEFRKAQFEERMPTTAPAFSNGADVPAEFPRYLIVECCYGGEEIWFFFADTLEQAARDIDDSETERDDIRVYDLDVEVGNDAGQFLTVMRVTQFINVGTLTSHVIHDLEPANG